MADGALFKQLRHVRRYTGCFLHHQESVAEHQWYVCLYALVIGLEAQQLGFEVDLGKLLQRAALHDVEEGVTGDFPRPFKYSDPALKAQLDQAAKRGFKRIFESLACSEQTRETCYEIWDKAKAKDNEGWLLSFCDLLAFLEFTLQEVRAGNRHILAYTTAVEDYLKSFEHPSAAVLQPFLRGARLIYEEILGC